MSQMHDCSQVIHSIVVVLLRQMSNCQYTSLLCLGAMLTSVTLSWLNKFCKTRRRQTTDVFISHYQHFEGDSTLN